MRPWELCGAPAAKPGLGWDLQPLTQGNVSDGPFIDTTNNFKKEELSSWNK